MYINFVEPENIDVNVPVKGKKFLVNKEKIPVIGLEIMKFMDNNLNITIIKMIIGCYTWIFPQVECKKCVNVSKKYSFFLSRQG
ncbi:MAG: hypothetical protein FWF54_06800, partial [Candidatus Azobacteroides sp.]|nr:hypothetical protein [Candidatus Azobacteroides sp.]